MNIRIERSRDYALLEAIATTERIYRITSDDFSPPRDDWRISQREDFIYLLAHEEKQLLGFCGFFPVNGVTFDVHVCFLWCAFGEKALLAFVRMLGWMWGATRAERICGSVPSYNCLAIAFARRAGFVVYGVNPRSWMKNAILHDQVMLGISRPTV